MHPEKIPSKARWIIPAIGGFVAAAVFATGGHDKTTSKSSAPNTPAHIRTGRAPKRLKADGQSVPLIAFKPNGHATFKYEAPKQGKSKDLAIIDSPDWTNSVMGVNSRQEVGMMLTATHGQILKRAVMFNKSSSSVAPSDISPAVTLTPGIQSLYAQGDFPSGSTEAPIPGEVQVTSTAKNLGVKVIEGILPPQNTSTA